MKNLKIHNPNLITFADTLFTIDMLGGVDLAQIEKMICTLRLTHKNYPPFRTTLDLYNDNQAEKLMRTLCDKWNLTLSEVSKSVHSLIAQLETYKLERLMTEYSTWLDTLGFSDSVVYNNTHHIRDFFLWLEDKQIHAISRLTQKHISQYLHYLEHRQHKQKAGHLLGVSCLNQNFIAVDKLLEFLHQYGMNTAPVPLNYRITPDPQERIRKIEILTQEEIKTLYKSVSATYPHLPFEQQQAKHHELRLIFALYYACGLRKTEAQNICYQDIDFDRKTVFVRQGKGSKDRIIPMSARVYNEIQDYIYNFRHRLKLEHNRLFVSVSRTLSKSLKHLQSICEDETIQAKRISPHILRHSIATHLLQNGMSIENIALFLGHTSLDSTQIYTHLA